MATLRPYKQLSLLLLASTSPWIPRALSTLSGGNSLRTPSFCRPLPRHPTPYPPALLGSAHSRPGAARGAQGRAAAGRSGQPFAPGTALSPRPLPAPAAPRRPRPRGHSPGRGGHGRERAQTREPCAGGFMSSLLWAASGTSSRFCRLSLSPDPECRLRCPRAGPALRCHLSLRSAERAAPQRSQTHQGG